MEVTILTPTYNRAYKLIDLFKSLQEQTNKDFEWYIVDDGSTDDTKKTVDSFKEEASFPIKYVYKENGGKHTALNLGIKNIESELTFIVDSDDSLTDEAIDTIYQYHKKYANNSELCGYTFLRCFPDGRINGKEFVQNEKISSYIESRINGNDAYSDKAEVFRTNCLKEFPFPEYPGERFLGEDIVWIRMGRKYQMVNINKAIYVGDYLEGGLTDNRRNNNIKSPLGCMNRAKEFMDPQLRIKYRIKATLQYIVYGKFAGKTLSQLVIDSQYKGLVVLFAFPGFIIYQKWKRQYK